MKKLSIEDKARLYDEALKEAAISHKDEDKHLKATLERIFPTLKESEDERIRKAIIEFVKYKAQESLKDKWIAWLEKQGESDETKAKIFLINKGYPIDANGKFPAYEEMYDIIKEGLEKQGEQESVAKVTPKYKVGDWLQYRNAKPFFVEEITKQGYVNGDSCLPFNWENEIHLWNISDARDGDVLVHNGCTFIFMGIKDGIVQAIEENLLEPISFGEIDKDNDYHPATKEQRDLLFSKMREAGYEWYAETKELKKIAHELAELPKGEDYGIDGLYAAIDILKKTLNKVEGYQTDDGILEHECAISAVKSFYEQKLVWSEEEENMLDTIIDILTKQGFQTQVNWLKSLKNRVQLKQEWSDEDEKFFKTALWHISYSISNGESTDIHCDTTNWLKSLKQRIGG